MPQIVNNTTGEIVMVRGASAKNMKPPKRKDVTSIDSVAGKNPPAVNLKDHPEFSGREIIIMEAKFKASTLGGDNKSYVLLACYMPAPGKEATDQDFVIIITGSENVQARIADAEISAGEGSPYPITGTLRTSKGGRAWFLD